MARGEDVTVAVEGFVSFGQGAGVGGGPAAGMLEKKVACRLTTTGHPASALLLAALGEGLQQAGCAGGEGGVDALCKAKVLCSYQESIVRIDHQLQ
jgi:hypothetical protein